MNKQDIFNPIKNLYLNGLLENILDNNINNNECNNYFSYNGKNSAFKLYIKKVQDLKRPIKSKRLFKYRFYCF